MAKKVPTIGGGSHASSHPSAAARSSTMSKGGASLAVQDNANVFHGVQAPPVKNASPATGKKYAPSGSPMGY